MRTAILCAAALALAGCGGAPKSLSVAGTPESCRAALVAALDGWKQGRAYQEMAEADPPILLRDDDFFGGAKLLDYQIEGNGELRGTGYSYVVTITLQRKEGKEGKGDKGPTKKKLLYNAVSEPKLAVYREDRKP